MNHSQRNLKKLIRAKEDSIADEELFLSAAYQKYQTSLPEPLPDVTGMDCRYCWTGTFPNRQALHIPTIIRYISTQRTRSPSLSPPVSYVPRA